MSRPSDRSAVGRRSVAIALLLILSFLPSAQRVASADDGDPIPAARKTDTVRLIERCLPAVVTIFAEVENGEGRRDARIGSGTIIHEAGFVLTNEHVVRGFRDGGVMLSDGRILPMRVVAKFMHDDLAIVQVKTDETLPTIPLGRSDDVMLGEPTLVIGSPGGLVHSVSTGIVSGVNRSTRNESNFLPWMIQTNAAVNRGNSGGPLINAVGEQIGVMATIGNNLQNVSFAISIDHVREVLPRMLSMEQRMNVWLGVTCDPLADGAIVSAVEEDSPAVNAGLLAGDTLLTVNGMEMTGGVDLQLALLLHGPKGELSIEYLRDEEREVAQVPLAKLKLPEPVTDVETEPGLEYAIYRGEWDMLPDFAELKPERSGRCQDILPKSIDAPDENVAITWTGLLRLPKDDLYAFYTSSDDGSRLWIGDRLVVDNDGLHPARENGGLIRLPAGLHRLRVEFFERSGEEVMEVAWEGGGMGKVPLEGDVLVSVVRDEAESGDQPVEDGPTD